MFVKYFLGFGVLSISTFGYSGITKTICSNGKYRVCIEDPNTANQIKLLSGEERHFLDEIEPYELFEERAGLFSFAFQSKILIDVDADTEIKLQCSEAKPGTCSGWNF